MHRELGDGLYVIDNMQRRTINGKDTMKRTIKIRSKPMTTKGTMLKCLRCGWEWLQRFDRTPVECPACKRRNWDRKD